MFFLQRIWFLLLTSFILTCLSFSSFAVEPDWKAYSAALQYLSPGEKNGTQLTLVDYQKLKDNGLLETAYQQLAKFPVKQLESQEEKLAFYINAYNILALKMVLDHFPLDSIKDIGNFFSPVWNKTAGKINGKNVSLDDVEHQIIRPMGEARIHMAIVCASVSCPDLRNEPYSAANLHEQLEDQTHKFLNNEQKGLTLSKNNIRISKIFDWFEKDFKKSGGVEVFIRRYKPDLPVLSIATDIPYDWSLNNIP